MNFSTTHDLILGWYELIKLTRAFIHRILLLDMALVDPSRIVY